MIFTRFGHIVFECEERISHLDDVVFVLKLADLLSVPAYLPMCLLVPDQFNDKSFCLELLLQVDEYMTRNGLSRLIYLLVKCDLDISMLKDRTRILVTHLIIINYISIFQVIDVN